MRRCAILAASVALTMTGCVLVVEDHRSTSGGHAVSRRSQVEVELYTWRYYPSSQVYYCVETRTYYWMTGSIWHTGRVLPPHIHLVGSYESGSLHHGHPQAFHGNFNAAVVAERQRGMTERQENRQDAMQERREDTREAIQQRQERTEERRENTREAINERREDTREAIQERRTDTREAVQQRQERTEERRENTREAIQERRTDTREQLDANRTNRQEKVQENQAERQQKNDALQEALRKRAEERKARGEKATE